MLPWKCKEEIKGLYKDDSEAQEWLRDGHTFFYCHYQSPMLPQSSGDNLSTYLFFSLRLTRVCLFEVLVSQMSSESSIC